MLWDQGCHSGTGNSVDAVVGPGCSVGPGILRGLRMLWDQGYVVGWGCCGTGNSVKSVDAAGPGMPRWDRDAVG